MLKLLADAQSKMRPVLSPVQLIKHTWNSKKQNLKTETNELWIQASYNKLSVGKG